MTNEEYLRVCGWVQWDNDGNPSWTNERFLDDRGHARDFTTSEALEVQLAEDRARLAFVLERSAVALHWPAPHLGPGFLQGHEGVEVEIKPQSA